MLVSKYNVIDFDPRTVMAWSFPLEGRTTLMVALVDVEVLQNASILANLHELILLWS